MILHILKPDAEDYKILTEICLESKKHWGYSKYLLEQWKDELTITPRFIRNHDILKIENELGEILCFGALEKNHSKGIYEIIHFWVLPAHMGKKIGKILLEHLEKKVEHQKTIKIVSDPNAMAFYQNFGYHKVGEEKSKPDGRKLPILKKIMNKPMEV